MIPSAPLLVPELAGRAATDTAAVRDAALLVGRRLAASARIWLAVGAADRPGPPIESSGYARRGDFGAYGVAVPVTLGRVPSGTGAVSDDAGAALPLSMLLAGWLAGRSAPIAAAAPATIPWTVDPAADAAACADSGRRLAAFADSLPEPVGLLVVADGATALTPKAPGGGQREAAVALQERIDEALASADTAALGDLDEADCLAQGVAGRAAWQVMAAACADRGMAADVVYRAAPFGVGYTVATWTPGTRR